MKKRLSKSRSIEAQALSLLEDGKSIDQIFEMFPNHQEELKEIFNTLNVLKFQGSNLAGPQKILQSVFNKSSNENKAKIHSKRVFSDIIRVKKKNIRNNTNRKSENKDNFLYMNDDDIYNYSNRNSKKAEHGLNIKENQLKHFSNRLLSVRNLFNINYKLYIGLTLVILIFFSINILNNSDTSTEIDNIAQELENENELYFDQIARIYQDYDDNEELIKKINDNFEEMLEIDSRTTVDELDLLEEELLYEINNLSDDIDELQEINISDEIENINVDITNI